MFDRPARSFTELVDFKLPSAGVLEETHATTVIALRYDEGALMLADRRATMGNLIMYEQAEKILPLDRTALIAISGSYARSLEVCRFLSHSFKFYERLHLSPMSAEGKLMEISRALAGNLPAAMQGVGVFLPILAIYDPKRDDFGLYFFDTAGARFQNAAYACAGSGSERIRGIFEYGARTKGAWHTRKFDDVLLEGLRMLDIAAELDSATGGFRKALPAAMQLTRDGVQAIDLSTLEKFAKKALA